MKVTMRIGGRKYKGGRGGRVKVTVRMGGSTKVGGEGE